MIVKICGLTRREDVESCREAGADLLGFVHHEPSPRHLSEKALVGLLEGLPAAAETVLVVVDQPRPRLERLALSAGVTRVQLCGREDPREFAAFPLPILRRLPVDDGAEAEIEAWRDRADLFVLDHPAAPGGTGRLVDLARAARLARLAPCLLAGGLDGETVGAAIKAVLPSGVDASSGLELAPGWKDPHKLQAFLRTVRHQEKESRR